MVLGIGRRAIYHIGINTNKRWHRLERLNQIFWCGSVVCICDLFCFPLLQTAERTPVKGESVYLYLPTTFDQTDQNSGAWPLAISQLPGHLCEYHTSNCHMFVIFHTKINYLLSYIVATEHGKSSFRIPQPQCRYLSIYNRISFSSFGGFSRSHKYPYEKNLVWSVVCYASLSSRIIRWNYSYYQS